MEDATTIVVVAVVEEVPTSLHSGFNCSIDSTVSSYGVVATRHSIGNHIVTVTMEPITNIAGSLDHFIVLAAVEVGCSVTLAIA